MIKAKGLISKLFALSLGVFTAVSATACGGLLQNVESAPPHTHEYGEWVRPENVENCEEGTYTRTCDSCGGTDTRKGEVTDHVWAAELGYNDTQHWTECVYCDVQKDAVNHENNGMSECKDCDYLIPSAGVFYGLSDDGTYAIVTDFDDSMTDVVVVANEYNGVPVMEIGKNAFEDCGSLSFLTLPDGVTRIGARAFSGCKRLMGVMLYDSVEYVGDNAFAGCEELTIFCEAESKPQGWSEEWNPLHRMTIWGHKNDRATHVAAGTEKVMDSMLQQEDASRRNTYVNPDLNGVRPPEGFMSLTRYDSKMNSEGAGWESGNLWYYNFSKMNLIKYSNVWFAVKLVDAFWAFVNGPESFSEPWAYIHLQQMGQNEYGDTLWKIEVSVGGQVYERIENQTGAHLDTDRTENSLARLLWDEGFNSKDGNGVLIYRLGHQERGSVYCTEVLGTLKNL